MIQIINKADCCGCEACVQVCPQKCISLHRDEEGFLYPEVNQDACVDCRLCEKVCPKINLYDEITPIDVLAAYNKDEEIRSISSSGGIFSLLANGTIEAGGVVFGARYDDHWQVVVDSTETKDGISAFRGSKYVQARVGDSYKRCKTFLEEGRNVLYTGTPCQIAGLKHFLRKSYKNLLTCDVVCYGVPSPKVWQQYLNEIIPVGGTIENINFRDKRYGWASFSFVADYKKDDKVYTVSSVFTRNTYMRAFLSKLSIRPSCYACPAKSGRGHSDISLADWWGAPVENPNLYDNKGTSLVLVRTEKGRDAILKESIFFEKVDYTQVHKYNFSEAISAKAHPQRSHFFSEFSKGKNLHKLVNKCLKGSFLERINSRYKELTLRYKLFIHKYLK